MFKVFSNRRGQSFLEYALLIAAIAASLMAMTQYIHRAVNVRLKQAQEELNESRR